jgi:hypothetical protein
MTVRKTFQGWECSTVWTFKSGRDFWVHMHYIGYSKREASRRFREYLASLN